VAGGSGRHEWSEVARRAVWRDVPAHAIGVGALLLPHHLRLPARYVAQHSARGVTLPYRVSALWGGQGGSLLLWVFISLIYASAAMWLLRDSQRQPAALGRSGAAAQRGLLPRADRSSRARDQPVHQLRPAT
jgi:hypothetical protein